MGAAHLASLRMLHLLFNLSRKHSWREKRRREKHYTFAYSLFFVHLNSLLFASVYLNWIRFHMWVSFVSIYFTHQLWFHQFISHISFWYHQAKNNAKSPSHTLCSLHTIRFQFLLIFFDLILQRKLLLHQKMILWKCF